LEAYAQRLQQPLTRQENPANHGFNAFEAAQQRA
jgi:hypothetical protein